MSKRPSARTLLGRAIDAAGKLSCEDLTIRSRLRRILEAEGTDEAPRLLDACFRDIRAWNPTLAEELRQALGGLSEMPHPSQVIAAHSSSSASLPG